MRRKRAFKRGRLVLIALAGGIGYLLGGWHAATTPRNTGLSPAQSVALRFPERTDAPVTMTGARDTVRSAMNSAGTMVLGDPQLLLLNPDPMVPRLGKTAQPATTTMLRSAASAAVAGGADAAARPSGSTAHEPGRSARRARLSPDRPARLRPQRRADRQHQERLHLTPGQQPMWPAVEAALHNIAYTRTVAATGTAPAGRKSLPRS